ncbi:DUF3179 domain-containing protein [Micrococcaceae bacterium Sec5.7]
METQPSPSRRQVLKGLAVLGGVAAVGGGAAVVWQILSSPDRKTAPSDPTSLEGLAGAVVSGGPGKDGIPAIDRPRFVSAAGADFLTGDQPVFGLDYGGEIRAYPQLVLVWHEIVNDAVGDQLLSITYCPLTGTAVGYHSPPGQKLTFGTTGNLVNSNLLMYDRQTDSQWLQILGTAITGPLKGNRLSTEPLVWTTWNAWRNAHPNTKVLSADTGFLRSYGTDPYGSYPRRSGYYASGEPIFPVQARDHRFAAKDVVVGVRAGDGRLAIHKDHLRRVQAIETQSGGTRVRAHWDNQLDTALVEQQVEGRWEAADYLDAMWFAWYAFYPHTEVLP